MAFELITGHAGRNHVDSADMGEAFAGIVGKGRYILDTGQGMACTMADSNTLRVGTGSMLMDGRIVRNETAATFKIANGTQGQYRHDLACLKYTLDRSNDSIESVTPIVLQGTAASSESAAKDPSYTAGDILSGDLTAIVPIARVKLAGLTPMCEKLLSSVTSLKSLGESVSHCLSETKIFSGDATEDFTLTDSVDNYHSVTFVYRDNDLRMGSTSLDDAQGKIVNCTTIGALPNTVVFKESSWKLNKTQATIQSYGECNSTGDSKVAVKNIHVLAVYGYKRISNP